ncbi:hypothetical protein BpHYR1_027490 [Brachionus plicatilis]|uniref:Uncharacterized protein n=1 Tax=Brachionus plicatilis TaxID=10195 RepID=A0A3M7RYR4_BRAPC|nr:hypothetical protein BpHYR1_027490 [Brachionus plicatilis]
MKIISNKKKLEVLTRNKSSHNISIKMCIHHFYIHQVRLINYIKNNEQKNILMLKSQNEQDNKIHLSYTMPFTTGK